MQKKFLSDDSRLYCFTPLVSLATFFIEFFLAFYILFRYKRTPFIILSAILLFLLGIFQLSEYMMCQASYIMLWGKIGSASITLLPVVGLHLVTLLTRKTAWLYLGYFIGALMVLTIFFLPLFVLDITCTGKFVILNPGDIVEIVYSIYYFFFLFMSLAMLTQSLKNNKKRQNILWMIVAYMSFILPTTVIVILFALSYNAIPSIMCGFALILAFIIVFKEIPLFIRSSSKTTSKKRKK